jgi:tol-pal system protein YbgF
VGWAQDGNDVAARIEKLEAEIATLKAMVGRLEASVRAKPSLAPDQESSISPASPDDLGQRVSALETQIGALTHQIEQMGRQTNAVEATDDTAPLAITPPAPEPPVAEEAPPAPQAPPPAEPDIMEALKEEAPQAAPPQAVDETDPSKPRWYGPEPGTTDEGPQTILPPSLSTGALPDDMPQSLAALPNANAQSLYEQGYGDFLQRDYAAAETAFNKLVNEYPNDPLAGSAQYWIGESQYVRKQYKKAADTFLATYRKYSGSDKAPDTLLRLGMSLAALGQKDAACSTFKELGDKFPDAPDHLRDQAKGEAGKAGC